MARARQFDERRLLDAAQEVFWVRGYERTSIEVIASSSGVGNGSIYAAYGNKLTLFLAVFARYCDGRAALVDEIIRTHVGDFESAVGNYFSAIIADCSSHPDRRGCLMINSLAELGPRIEEVRRIGAHTINKMEASMARRIRQAVDEERYAISPEAVAPLASHIVLVSQALIEMSHLSASDAQLRAIADTSTRLTTARIA
ncbi:TetR/AcrR family transcriptional regulator [Frondihabitans australicus]|uniref:TetR family transcriptional regulator n=1 Tax=Frondihabitans australicus TaxID=386892 RepID=A0A495IM60_9MICO|nr:TetR/AcrR family transcriptional regulator [Frondihabitans australicus]RKR76351.1 TetR family transcriptional regulator [Frondihabitans australicus]